MSEERRRILQMVAEGKVSVPEAEQLLAAVESPGGAAGETGSGPRRKPKYLRVVVEPIETGGDAARGSRVNVRVPLDLVRAGLKLEALLPDRAREKVTAALQSHGISLDLKGSRELIEELIEHLGDLTVDVENEREKVRVFCE
jgi:uncharacterized protein (DUF433 family)